MADQFEWVVVSKFGRDIGAIGFIGDDVVAIASYYDGRDGNKDGEVSLMERVGSSLFGMENAGVAEVAMAARNNVDIYQRDPSIRTVAADIFTSFAAGLVADGIWQTYFRAGVRHAATGVAASITSNKIKQLVIRKGFETAARRAFTEVTTGV